MSTQTEYEALCEAQREAWIASWIHNFEDGQDEIRSDLASASTSNRDELFEVFIDDDDVPF